MREQKLILDYIYQHEAAQPERVFLTQPVGGGKVVDYTWSQTVEQARRLPCCGKGDANRFFQRFAWLTIRNR